MKDKANGEHVPDIWLQENEQEGEADCGCNLYYNVQDGPETPAFDFCPLHAAAADLLKACKAARISILGDEDYERHKPLIRTLEAAIAKAKPPKQRKPDWFA